ncbi:hypothetical protein PVAP13_2KG195558 [Panicum virgatum]|uniref:Uncharacterized protein n=1 Tax=Panicum virgatum TaxID=38727 RepID=A0A8T0W635_PANVG|nr:hypothetical protein PVAP13_2KG195558 [Panicum virgatum]
MEAPANILPSQHRVQPAHPPSWSRPNQTTRPTRESNYPTPSPHPHPSPPNQSCACAGAGGEIQRTPSAQSAPGRGLDPRRYALPRTRAAAGSQAARPPTPSSMDGDDARGLHQPLFSIEFPFFAATRWGWRRRSRDGRRRWGAPPRSLRRQLRARLRPLQQPRHGLQVRQDRVRHQGERRHRCGLALCTPKN